MRPKSSILRSTKIDTVQNACNTIGVKVKRSLQAPEHPKVRGKTVPFYTLFPSSSLCQLWDFISVVQILRILETFFPVPSTSYICTSEMLGFPQIVYHHSCFEKTYSDLGNSWDSLGRTPDQMVGSLPDAIWKKLYTCLDKINTKWLCLQKFCK